MSTEPEDAGTSVDLPFHPPFSAAPALAMLAAHDIPGSATTDVDTATHTRLLTTHSEPRAVTVTLTEQRVTLTVASDRSGDLAAVTPAVRRWLDLDARPDEVRRVLGADDIIGPLIAARPGLRIIGSPHGFEAAATTVLGQQVSRSAARTFQGRLVAAHGSPHPSGLVAFPGPGTVAASTPAELRSTIGLTNARARTLHAVAEAFAAGLTLAPDADHEQIRRRLLALPGVGPWTADYLALRALGDRDAYPAHDLVLRRALRVGTPSAARALAEPWSPYRAYAAMHLWTHISYGHTANPA